MRKKCAFTLCSLFPLLLCAQTSPGKTNVTGTVVNVATGDPIPGAFVWFQGMVADPKPDQQPVLRRALSDGTGRFSFSVPGRFTGNIYASRQGFFSETGTGEAWAAFKADSSEVTLKLVPLGVFQGRVTTRDGEALPDVAVRLMHVKIEDGRRRAEQIAQSLTDDRGEYRLWHIFPGSYYLLLTGKSESVWNMGSLPNLPSAEETYGPLYYPKAETQEQAQMLHLHGGETITADFSATSHAAYKISGQLRVPGNSAAIRLLRAGGSGGERVAVNRSNGAFQISDVVPGIYTLQAYVKRGEDAWYGEAQVQVLQHDITGLVVALSTPVEVQGSVEFLGTSTGQNATIRAIPRSPLPGPGLSTQPQSVDANGNFKLKLVPGSYDIVATSAAHYPESIVWNTQDVLGDGLNFEPGAVPELKVSMHSGGAYIQGTVADGDADSEGFNLLVVRAGGSKIDVRQVVFGDRRFFLNGLAPGDYNLIALPRKREVEYRNPVVLQQLSGHARAINLHEGANETVTLKLAPEEN